VCVSTSMGDLRQVDGVWRFSASSKASVTAGTMSKLANIPRPDVWHALFHQRVKLGSPMARTPKSRAFCSNCLAPTFSKDFVFSCTSITAFFPSLLGRSTGNNVAHLLTQELLHLLPSKPPRRFSPSIQLVWVLKIIQKTKQRFSGLVSEPTQDTEE
jgi:hypothetical protein